MSSNHHPHQHPHPHPAPVDPATPRREEAPETFKGAVLTVQALCALLVVWGLWNATDTATFLLFSKATSGHVVSRQEVKTPSPSRNGYPRSRLLYATSTYVEIGYSDRHGRLRSFDVPLAACLFADEARLPIRYDDGEPPRAKVCTFLGLWAKATMLVALGVGGWFFVGWAFG